jgi:hypothetical protein
MGTTALIVGSTILSVAGQLYQGSIQATAARDKAKQAQIAGASSMLSARQKAAALQKDKARLKGKQVAQAAGSGMDVGSKTLIDIQQTTDKQAEDDISAVLSQGRMALATSNATASSYKNQAGGYMSSGVLGAGTSILGGTMAYGKIAGWEGFDKF